MRSATAQPGCDERGGLGAISGPPCKQIVKLKGK